MGDYTELQSIMDPIIIHGSALCIKKRARSRNKCFYIMNFMILEFEIHQTCEFF